MKIKIRRDFAVKTPTEVREDAALGEPYEPTTPRYWAVIVADNGEVLFTSQAYTRKENAIGGARAAFEGAIDTWFKIAGDYASVDKSWFDAHWTQVLVDETGE